MKFENGIFAMILTAVIGLIIANSIPQIGFYYLMFAFAFVLIILFSTLKSIQREYEERMKHLEEIHNGNI